jgi:hypothetical protein
MTSAKEPRQHGGLRQIKFAGNLGGRVAKERLHDQWLAVFFRQLEYGSAHFRKVRLIARR